MYGLPSQRHHGFLTGPSMLAGAMGAQIHPTVAAMMRWWNACGETCRVRAPCDARRGRTAAATGGGRFTAGQIRCWRSVSALVAFIAACERGAEAAFMLTGVWPASEAC